MGVTELKIYGGTCATVTWRDPDTVFGAESEFYSGSRGGLLLQRFEDVPDDLKYREIYVGNVYFYVINTEGAEGYETAITRILGSGFDPGSVTYNTMPSGYNEFTADDIDLNQTPGYCSIRLSWFDEFESLINKGLVLQLAYTDVYTSEGTYKPYILVQCSDAPIGYDVKQTYPIDNATISKSIPTTFSWANTLQSTQTLYKPQVTGTKFRWRVAGETSYTELNELSATAVTIPANTFANGSIEWQVEVTANSGAVTTTPWTTVSVTEPTSSATINAPKNAVVDGATELTFSWNHIIANGTKPTGFDLQTSPDGEAWTTLRTVSGSDTSVVIPAGTFTAGDLYWRVRTYNLDSVAGSWSEAAHVIVIAAPAAPGVTVESAEPSFQIRWQQTGQQAYEITLDDQVIAKRYGVETNYQYDGYLAPGTYTIKVRIQNQYSLWSDWGVLSLTIANTEGEAITLTAEGDNDVTLSWSGDSAYSKYIVYRNDVKLGETAHTSIVDHFALGTVKYQVRGVYADSGNYTLSNVVYVTVTVDTIMIADVDDPVWLRLDKSTSSLRATSISDARSVTYLHYIGAKLPSAEIGEPVSKTYRLDCAWSVEDAAHIAAFERLTGKVVCIKTAQNRRFIGVMGELTSSENCMIVSYQVPITLIDWEDKLQGGDSDDGLPGSESGGSVASMIIDATLTKEGAAAEAKATGDRLSALEKALEGFLDEAAALIGGV